MVHVRLEYQSVYYATLHSHNVLFFLYCMHAGPRTAVGRAVSLMSQRPQIRYPVRPHTFFSPFVDSRRAVASYWRKYVDFIYYHYFFLNYIPHRLTLFV